MTWITKLEGKYDAGEGTLYQVTQWEDTEIQQRSLSEEEVKVVFYWATVL